MLWNTPTKSTYSSCNSLLMLQAPALCCLDFAVQFSVAFDSEATWDPSGFGGISHRMQLLEAAIPAPTRALSCLPTSAQMLFTCTMQGPAQSVLLAVLSSAATTLVWNRPVCMGCNSRRGETLSD